jgi:hypothetical protein
MQVELAVQSAKLTGNWNTFLQVCRWFSIIVLVLTLMVSAFVILLILFMFIHDQIYAQKVLRRKRSSHKRPEAGMKSALV